MRTRPYFPSTLLPAMAFIMVCALLFPARVEAARDKTPPRYLRGVYVLRHMNPGGHWPEITIPRRVRVDDATNALLMHPDKNFVLTTILPDLETAAASGRYPVAGYYAAHAASMLGRHKNAAASMKAYMGKAPFREEDHLFLVRELYAANDYVGTREAARQWQILDASADSCSEDRLLYVWGSLHAQGRHREAMEAVLSDPCASWRGQLLFARSCQALGDEEWAEARFVSVLEAFPEKAREIHLFWNRLATADKYP